MGYASKAGRARISARNPRALAICDRCGLTYNHVNLQWQYDWRGASLQNLRILVCDSCLDTPQQQLRSIVVPADPVPIMNPRTQDWAVAETNTRATSGQNAVDSKTGIPVINGDTRITNPTNPDILPSFYLGLEDGTGDLVQENGALLTSETLVIPDDLTVYTRVTQQTGEPPYGKNQEPGTDPNAPGNDDPGLPYNMDLVPKTGPLDE